MIWTFIAGLVLGGFFGMILMAVLAAGKDTDYREGRWTP